MKSLKDFNYLLSLDRRYTKTESEIFRYARGRRILSGNRFRHRLRLALLSPGTTRDDLIGFRVNFADSLRLEHDVVPEFRVITILATLNIGHATLVTDLDFSDFDGEFSIHNDSPANGCVL